MIDLNNVSLVIATYNEEESIEFVLNELNSYEFFEIIVIDNNSSDKTLEIANKFNTLLMGMVAAERVFNIIDTDSAIQNLGNLSADYIKGEIIYNDVSFAYQKGEKIIDKFNLKINPGSTNAFVGATGSGKSTIIKLLNRFYELDSGSIYIDKTKFKIMLSHL